MGGALMLVMVAFVRNLVIGQVHSGHSDYEPVDRLM
jgi:hypothetical protein